jgi:phospholipid/cholesterol/gamma-HCH transport system permease protein
MEREPLRCELSFSRPTDDTLLIRLRGSWRIGQEFPSADEVRKQFRSDSRVKRLAFDTKELTGWDSALLAFLVKVRDLSLENNIDLDTDGLSGGVKRLLSLTSSVPEKKDTRAQAIPEPFLSRVGTKTVQFVVSAGEMLAFIGEAFVAFVKFLGGRARYRRSDLFLVIQQCGAEALPIVSLISILVGLILAFIGAVQLRMFGAQIYVADLVGIAMVRVMGAVMAAIIMAGRTGAAFAAELGTMQVNEEIDALRTLGISPIEFLVLPRMLALALMMPLLCLYSDLMGILGGLAVGVTMLDLNPVVYFNQTRAAVSLNHFWVGLFHSVVFGVLVALAGCLRGMQCGRSASAVGEAATSAVVTAIVSIVVATAIITFVCNVIGI